MEHNKLSEDSNPESNKDWVAGALVFAQALSKVIPDGEGVLIKATGEAADYFGPKEGLLIVSNAGGQMQIMPLDDVLDDTSDFTDGMWITISPPNEEGKEDDELNFEMDAE